ASFSSDGGGTKVASPWVTFAPANMNAQTSMTKMNFLSDVPWARFHDSAHRRKNPLNVTHWYSGIPTAVRVTTTWNHSGKRSPRSRRIFLKQPRISAAAAREGLSGATQGSSRPRARQRYHHCRAPGRAGPWLGVP